MLQRILRWLRLARNQQPTHPAAPGSAAPPLSPMPHAPVSLPLTGLDAPSRAATLISAAEAPSPPAAAPSPASSAPARPAAREIEITAGIDFGTSCTKIAVRLPYDPGEPTYAIPVPPNHQAEQHPHLWRSELWLASDGVLSLDSIEGAARLGRLKCNLMDWPELHVQPGPDPSAIEAAAAFLALQMRRTRKWFATKRPDLANARSPLRWSWHIGFPAASLDGYERRLRYEICLAAALDLASSTAPLTLASVRESVQRARESASLRLEEAGAALFPEITAAVAGFAHSPRHEDGLYAIIDVGAATFDCCTFNLAGKTKNELRCSIFMADVSLLGVEPLRSCEGNPELAHAFRKKLDLHIRTVIWQTRIHYKLSPRWESGLSLFLIGGGAASEPHRACAESLTCWLRKSLGTDKFPHARVHIIPLPIPELLDYEGDPSTVHRLAVAVGLSMPADQIPTVRLPDETPCEPPPPPRNVEENYVDPSMV